MWKQLSGSVRQPVRRQGAERYILYTLLSFAASVSTTRLYLSLTGYPKVGRGEYHIAHVLWGGLLLFIAAILPVIIANRWAYTACSILAGVGVGLFIDEVGKFITQSNNYFFPLAAPIIYAFFLLTVLLYLRVKQPPSDDPRAELYRSFDALEEVLEHDLEPHERDDLVMRLKSVAASDAEPDLSHLAQDLLEYFNDQTISLVPTRPSSLARLTDWLHTIEERYLNETRLRALITGGMLALGLLALVYTGYTLPLGQATGLQRTLLRLVRAGAVRSSGGLNWFAARLALESSVGLIMLASAGLLLIRRVKAGIDIGFLGLLLAITTVDLLVFYFDQFSTILRAIMQFLLLIAVIHYRRKYLMGKK